MFDQHQQIDYLYKNLERFKVSSQNVFKLLKTKGLVLNFLGYSDTIEMLYFLDEGDPESVFEACKEIILWIDYLTVLRHRTGDLLSSIENRLDYLNAFVDYERVNPQLDEMISSGCEEYSKIQLFLKDLDSQISLLRKHYKIIQYRYNELSKEMARIN